MIEYIESEDMNGKRTYVAVTNGETTTVMPLAVYEELEAAKEAQSLQIVDLMRRKPLAKYLDSVAWTCDKYLFLYRLRHISSTGRERFTWHIRKPQAAYLQIVLVVPPEHVVKRLIYFYQRRTNGLRCRYHGSNPVSTV